MQRSSNICICIEYNTITFITMTKKSVIHLINNIFFIFVIERALYICDD